MVLGSDSVEEYLEAIHSFNERGKRAKNFVLAKRLKVAPPSVTQMVKKLADRGYVRYVPYRGTFLTGRGMAVAQRVVRKHRLLERFLYDYLGMDMEKVHDEACRMEHSLSDEAALALCEGIGLGAGSNRLRILFVELSRGLEQARRGALVGGVARGGRQGGEEGGPLLRGRRHRFQRAR